MRKTPLFLLLILLGFQVFAQKTITGRIIGADDQLPMPGVSILVQGTSVGTITDLNGEYSLDVPEGEEQVLTYSFIGYSTQKIALTDQTKIDVLLATDTQGLDEIIVVGYGVTKKSLVTGAIAKIDADEITSSPSLRVEQALQGRTSGVAISQESGAPGGALTVRIRGTGSNKNADPLYIVDGMRTTAIDFLDPSDIASVEVLKDAASAAIYGAEGANGVVLITTKTGSPGQKGEISYEAYFGIQQIARPIDVMNAKEYATYMLEAHANDGRSDSYIEKQNIPDPSTLGDGTDWLGEIFETAPMQKHHLTFRGGSEQSSYLASCSYYTQDGIVGGDKTNFTRYTARFNGDHKVNNWLSVGSRIAYTHFASKDVSENSEFGGVIGNAMAVDPLTPVTYNDTTEIPTIYLNGIKSFFNDWKNSSAIQNADGYYGMSERVTGEIINPVAQINNDHGLSKTEKLLGGIFAEANIIKGLTFKTKFDIDLRYQNYSEWTPQTYYHDASENRVNKSSKSINRWFNWQWENYVTYNKSIGEHNIQLLAGTSARVQTFASLTGRGEYLLEEGDDYRYLNYTGSDTVINASDEDFNENRLLSYFGRVAYNYNERYMFNAVLRADGSSKFGPENKFGYFPSVSAGWVVTNEEFWPVEQIGYLKIRASWGRNGSLSSLDDFMYVSTIDGSSFYYLAGAGDESMIGAAEPSAISNKALKWETSEQVDLGVDLGLFDNRLSLSFDYYKKSTKDLLMTGSVPDYVGNNPPWVNAGDVENKGLEFEASYRKSTGDFNYDISFNAAFLKNEVIELGGGSERLAGANVGTAGAVTYFEPGLPAWYFYGLKTDGVFDNIEEVQAYTNAEGEMIQPNAVAGDVKFLDLGGAKDDNGNDIPDGKINDDDKTEIGNPHPKWTFGASIGLDYKGFDFYVLFQGVTGNDLYNAVTRMDRKDVNKPSYYYEDRWTTENTSADWFRATIKDKNQNYRISDLFVESGSYLRVKNISLGYTIPSSVLNKVGLKKVRVYVSAQNPLLFTKYRGLDPEIGITDNDTNNNQRGASFGVDRGTYPQAKVFLFGIQVGI